MMNTEWTNELLVALQGTGWIAQWPGVADDSSMYFADVVSITMRERRYVSLSRDRFPTVEARRAELIRQLSTSRRA